MPCGRSFQGAARVTRDLSLLMLLAAGCAGSDRAGALPPLLPESSLLSPGYPFGESGLGPAMTGLEIAGDPDYGWDRREPVRLGGYGAVAPEYTAEERQVRFLNALWGPAGETVLYERVGTCCPYVLYGAPLDKATLDVYALEWEGLTEPRYLYLDRYRQERVLVPLGLTTRSRTGPRP